MPKTNTINPKLEGHASPKGAEWYLHFDWDTPAQEVADYFTKSGFESRVINSNLLEIDCLDHYDNLMVDFTIERGGYFVPEEAETYTHEQFNQLYTKND